MSSSTIIGGGSSSSIKTSSTLLMVLGCVVAVAGVAMTVSHLRGRRAPIVTADASAASTSASASAKKKAKKKRGKKSLKPSAESMTESETVPVPVAPAPSPVTPVNSSEDAKVPVVAAPSPVATVPASKAVPSPVKKEEVPEKKKETPAISIPASLTPSDDELAALSKADRAARALEAKALGNKFFTSKRYEKGIELYSMAIRLNPDPVYFSNRAACYASLNDFANVVADCNRALELDQHYVKALTRRARAYENLGQASNALNDYTAVCVLEEFKNESSLTATDLFLKKLAADKTDEIMKTKEYNLPSETFIKAYMDSFRQTSTSLDKILTADTLEEGDKLVQKAFELVGQKQWAQALQVCNEALASAIDSLSPPFEALALNLRGTFSFLTGKIEDAMVDMEKSYEIDSHNVDTIVKRATLYMEKAEVEKAVRIFEEAEKENPDHPDLYYHRGQIRFLINDLAGSIQDYKKSVSLDSSSIYAYIQLGVAQYKLGEHDKSKRTFENAMKKFNDSHEVYNYYGEILLDQGKFDKAMEYLNKAIEIDPKSSLPYINKAILFLQSKQDPVSAEAECRKAVEADPLSDIALSQLAQLLSLQNKTEEAIEFYNRAIKVTRTKNEIMGVVSCREAACAQLFVVKNYPDAFAKIKPAT